MLFHWFCHSNGFGNCIPNVNASRHTCLCLLHHLWPHSKHQFSGWSQINKWSPSLWDVHRCMWNLNMSSLRNMGHVVQVPWIFENDTSRALPGFWHCNMSHLSFEDYHYGKQDTIVEDNFVFSCSSICSRPRDYSQTILHLWLNIHCEIMNDSKENTPKSSYRTAENVEIVISRGNQMNRILEFCKYHDFSSIKLHPPKSVHIGVEGCSSFRKTQRWREGVNRKKEHERVRS